MEMHSTCNLVDVQTMHGIYIKWYMSICSSYMLHLRYATAHTAGSKWCAIKVSNMSNEMYDYKYYLESQIIYLTSKLGP